MKTILITGSTDGIGKLTAIKLAQKGYHIILHGRNSEKLHTTITEMKFQSANKHITGFLSDLSDFNSIKKMVLEISKDHTQIDVLINNAGVFHSSRRYTENGLDLRYAVNYLAPYLLTNELMPLLLKSNSPRVVHLSSAAQASVSIKALRGLEEVSVNEAYAQSKLALTMWSFAFAKANPKIVSIAVNPGSLLNTKMVQEAYGEFWSTPDKGADILVEIALENKHAQNSGRYYDNDKDVFSDAHPDAYDDLKMEQLLDVTKQILS